MTGISAQELAVLRPSLDQQSAREASMRHTTLVEDITHSLFEIFMFPFQLYVARAIVLWVVSWSIS